MDESTQITLTAGTKQKKQRSEAQINATKRALEALQAKRKEQWEKKKEEIIESAPQKKESIPIVKNDVPVPIVAPVPIQQDKPTTTEIPEWAKIMYEKIESLSNKHEKPTKKKQKKRVIIEESSDSESSDEEVIIKKKKKHITPPPPAPTPIEKPTNPLRQLLNRR